MPSDIYQADPPNQSRADEGRERERERQRRQSDIGPGLLSSATTSRRPGTSGAPAEIDETLSRPGSVRINVTGAFIVDQDTRTPTTPDGRSGSPGRHETKDIRLPNHTAVVSHIAIDVGTPILLLFFRCRMCDL